MYLLLRRQIVVFFLLLHFIGLQTAIIEEKFPQFVQKYILKHYPSQIPDWVLDALQVAGFDLDNFKH